MNPFEKIINGVEWAGKEIGKGIAAVPKVITLAEDAEDAAKVALPEVLEVVNDAGQLTIASAKDGGKFLVSFAALSASISLALAAKAVNIAADEAVAAAFESFIAEFKEANVADVLTAWHQLVSDTAKLDATVKASIEKIEKDG
jgi:hypothetical protein